MGGLASSWAPHFGALPPGTASLAIDELIATCRNGVDAKCEGLDRGRDPGPWGGRICFRSELFPLPRRQFHFAARQSAVMMCSIRFIAAESEVDRNRDICRGRQSESPVRISDPGVPGRDWRAHAFDSCGRGFDPAEPNGSSRDQGPYLLRHNERRQMQEAVFARTVREHRDRLFRCSRPFRVRSRRFRVFRDRFPTHLNPL